MNLEKLITKIEHIAPPEAAEEWDNCGIQIAFGDRRIDRVLVCLEITEEVLKEAIREEVDLIVTHHPLIFSSIKSIDYEQPDGRYIIELIKNRIAVYSAHTSFDNAPFGNNYYLSKMLNLKGIEEKNSGITGYLSETLKFEDVVEYVDEMLGLPPHNTKGAGRKDLKVHKVGICCGSGSFFFNEAIEDGAELLITGDVKYHLAQDAIARDKAIIDAGHYGTEKFFTENFVSQLQELCDEESADIKIVKSKTYINPFTIF